MLRGCILRLDWISDILWAKATVIGLIIGEGGPADTASIPLATKQGRDIPNVQRLEKTPAQLSEARRMWTGAFPQIQLRSLSATYNCVGLVFASRRAFVDIDEAPGILADDGYRRVARDEVVIGDLVVYRKQVAGGGDITESCG